MALEDVTATSDENGFVSFSGIPSGHSYILTETMAPEGYTAGSETYTVTVAYDTVTVTVTDEDGQETQWSSASDYRIVNDGMVELPLTGGAGTLPFTTAGCLLMDSAALLRIFLHCRKKKALR